MNIICPSCKQKFKIPFKTKLQSYWCECNMLHIVSLRMLNDKTYEYQAIFSFKNHYIWCEPTYDSCRLHENATYNLICDMDFNPINKSLKFLEQQIKEYMLLS